MKGSKWIALGAVSGAVTVTLGAFGAHALEERVSPEDLAIWETAVHYQGLHALALVLFGLWRNQGGKGCAAGWGFLAGSAIFAGTLYAIVLGGPRWLGAITPIGGTLLIAGWLAFSWTAWRAR
ncbi:MAG TPA: DUF423 domain-containing protein [Planctomycetota bacterium]|nr:DUF423 domain-containing protein [Planctomycetota bacterium]